jgi:hypothetical protein
VDDVVDMNWALQTSPRAWRDGRRAARASDKMAPPTAAPILLPGSYPVPYTTSPTGIKYERPTPQPPVCQGRPCSCLPVCICQTAYIRHQVCMLSR